jgi:O-antigen/teichoic acid export membrane protein
LAAAGLIQGIAAFRIVSRVFGGPENSDFLLSQGRVARLVGIGLGGAAVNAGLDVLLIPRLGAGGAVIGSGVGNMLVNILSFAAVRSLSSVRLQLGFWLRIVIATAAPSLVCALLIPAQSALLVGAQMLLYVALTLGLFLLLKPLTSRDLEWLERVDKRLGRSIRSLVPRGGAPDHRFLPEGD